MEPKHNIIRSALGQAPGTQLPEGFAERLMERLRHESARRERRETWLLGIAGMLCLLAVVAGLVWYFLYEPGVGLQMPDLPEFPGLPSIKLPEPDFPEETRRLSLFYIFIAATFLGLSGLDFYLRKRRRNASDTTDRTH